LAGRKGDASTVFLRLFGRAAGTKTGVALRELSAIELEQVSGGARFGRRARGLFL
jgi:hypothetical protein